MSLQTSADPTFEEVLNGIEDEPAPTPEAPKPQLPPEEDKLKQTEEKLEYHRKLRAAEKRIKELEERAKSASEKAESGIDLNSSNPFRELAKKKNLTQDDVVKMALEAMDDEETEKKPMTPEEIIAEAKRQILEEQKKIKDETEQEAKAREAYEKNTKVIDDYLTANEEKFPLVKGLGSIGAVYSLIEKDFKEKAEEFGDDYAKKNMLSIEDAAKKIHEGLANGVKDALKSNHVRNFVRSLLTDEKVKDKAPDPSDDEIQLDDYELPTLNNGQFKTTAPSKKFEPQNDDEAFKAALALLD